VLGAFQSGGMRVGAMATPPYAGRDKLNAPKIMARVMAGLEGAATVA